MPKQPSNKAVYWKLKDIFTFIDAAQALCPKDDSTIEHLLVLAHSNLDDFLCEFKELDEADDEASEQAYANLKQFNQLPPEKKTQIAEMMKGGASDCNPAYGVNQEVIRHD